MDLSNEAFRERLLRVLHESGLSRRGLSRAMGRDPGYVAALLDPSRPSRARPSPTDLLRASDATGIPFVELLESLWAIPTDRLVAETRVLGLVSDARSRLTQDELAQVADFIEFLAARRPGEARKRDRATS